MMPLDKPLKIRTWNDATHLVFDHLIEHEQFSINQMKTNFNLHHRLRENDRERSQATKKMLQDLDSFRTTFNNLLTGFENIFDPRITFKLHALMGELKSTATLASRSFEESRQHYDQMVIWLQAVNLCHNQNQRDIRNFLQEQAISQHRDDYKLPSPKHRNPFKEWINLHSEWDEKTAKIIEGSLPAQALQASLGALSFSNDTFRKNVVPSMKNPFFKSTATKALHKHVSRDFNKIFSSASATISPSFKACVATVKAGDSSSQIAPE